MILVRDLFQLKFGKAREVKGLWSEMSRLQQKHGHPASRAMFDLVGPYYTFVMESTFDSLAAYEKTIKEMMATSDFAASYQKLVPLVESGRREIFELVQ